jgi:hypothetical protein
MRQNENFKSFRENFRILNGQNLKLKVERNGLHEILVILRVIINDVLSWTR